MRKHFYILVLIFSLATLFSYAGNPSKVKYYLNGAKKYEMERLPGQVMKITSYYRSGQVKEVGHYKKGKRHGWFQNFDQDGVQRTTAFFLGDKKDGFWTFYYPSGEVHRYVFFSKNKVLKFEEYDLVEERNEYDY